MAEDRAALVARLRELEQTCKAQADAYEGDYRAWLERAEAVHHAIAALSTPPARSIGGDGHERHVNM